MQFFTNKDFLPHSQNKTQTRVLIVSYTNKITLKYADILVLNQEINTLETKSYILENVCTREGLDICLEKCYCCIVNLKMSIF